MKNFTVILCLLVVAIGNIAYAHNIEYQTSANLRAIYGYTNYNKPFKNLQDKHHFPLSGNLDASITYEHSNDVAFNVYGKIAFKTDSQLENLNQGHWGEELTLSAITKYGDFYIGQMPNAAAQLSITNANLPVWQITPSEIVDFINNPNWKQKNKIKYYATLPSTTPNTDGSSIKFSYFTPEYKSTTLGISYTPENKSNDSLVCEFV